MAMNFDIPDITENGEKASAGGQRRKPKRIGALRLGDTLRAVSRHYTATLENKDEDKEAEFYSLSEGEEKHPSTGWTYPSPASASERRRSLPFTLKCRQRTAMIS